MKQDNTTPKGEEERDGDVVEAFLGRFLVGIEFVNPISGGFGVEFRRLSVARFPHLSLFFSFL